jgi:hypothetical protein
MYTLSGIVAASPDLWHKVRDARHGGKVAEFHRLEIGGDSPHGCRPFPGSPRVENVNDGFHLQFLAND